MDGSSFDAAHAGAGVFPEDAPELTALLLPPSDRPDARERSRHRFALGVAAAAHLALLAALLPYEHDDLGDEGIALETIAVSIIDAVPVVSAPEANASEAREQQTDADQAKDSAQRPEPQPKPDDTVEEPVPPKPSLALDVPPEPPAPDASSLPAREAVAKPDPEPVVREPPRTAQLSEATPPQPPPAAAAPMVLPSISSAEASPGIERAYAKRLAQLLDSRKPRSRETLGLRGRVIVQFMVDAAGKPERATVLATSGSSRLDGLAIATIERLEFPAPPPEMSQRQRTFNVPFAFR